MANTNENNEKVALHVAMGVLSTIFQDSDIFKCAICPEQCRVDPDSRAALVLPCLHVMHSHCLRFSTIHHCPACVSSGRQILIDAQRASLPHKLDEYTAYVLFRCLVSNIGLNKDHLSPTALKTKILESWSNLPHGDDLPQDFPGRAVFAQKEFPDESKQNDLETAFTELADMYRLRNPEYPFEHFREMVKAMSATYTPSVGPGASTTTGNAVMTDGEPSAKRPAAAVSFAPAPIAVAPCAVDKGQMTLTRSGPFGGMTLASPHVVQQPQMTQQQPPVPIGGFPFPKGPVNGFPAKFASKAGAKCSLCNNSGWAVNDMIAYVPGAEKKVAHLKCVNDFIATTNAAAAASAIDQANES